MDYPVLRNKKLYTDPRSGEEIYDLLTLTYAIPEYVDYQIYKVTKEHVARPDLISLAYYGSTDYVDVICKVNGVSNPYELNEGMLLVLPSLTDAGRFIYAGDNIQQSQDNKNSAPVPKAKNEKRKANEAIIGDKRFKIDKENRVVIY